MRSNAAHVPQAVIASGINFSRHPIIAQAFTPSAGWKIYPMNKRISRAWVRSHLVPDGITHVQLTDAGERGKPGHYADFSVSELLGVRGNRASQTRRSEVSE